MASSLAIFASSASAGGLGGLRAHATSASAQPLTSSSARLQSTRARAASPISSSAATSAYSSKTDPEPMLRARVRIAPRGGRTSARPSPQASRLMTSWPNFCNDDGVFADPKPRPPVSWSTATPVDARNGIQSSASRSDPAQEWSASMISRSMGAAPSVAQRFAAASVRSIQISTSGKAFRNHDPLVR